MHASSPEQSSSRLRQRLYDYILERIQADDWHHLTPKGDNLLTLIAEHAFNDLAVTLLHRMPSKIVPVSLRIDGATPLLLAASTGNSHLLECLLSHPLGQATINQGCNNGTNPLMIAILRRDYHMIKHLLCDCFTTCPNQVHCACDSCQTQHAWYISEVSNMHRS